MCADCAAFLRSNKPGRTLRAFLDALPVPVLAVDAQARVRIVNAAAESMLQRPRAVVEGQLGGDAMECAYARLREGCGRTIHCKACTIRRTVMETHATGRSQVNVEALQQICFAEGSRIMRFLISTRKRGDLVLLRIDEAEPAGPVSCFVGNHDSLLPGPLGLPPVGG